MATGGTRLLRIDVGGGGSEVGAEIRLPQPGQKASGGFASTVRHAPQTRFVTERRRRGGSALSASRKGCIFSPFPP
jgi:hypothetical protein